MTVAVAEDAIAEKEQTDTQVGIGVRTLFFGL
jgi:hypothetical protein